MKKSRLAIVIACICFALVLIVRIDDLSFKVLNLPPTPMMIVTLLLSALAVISMSSFLINLRAERLGGRDK